MLGGRFESDLNHTIETGLELALEGSRIMHSLLINRGVAIPKESTVQCAEVKRDVSKVFRSLQRENVHRDFANQREVSGPRR